MLLHLNHAASADSSSMGGALGFRNAKYDELVPEHLLLRFCGRRNGQAISAITEIVKQMVTN